MYQVLLYSYESLSTSHTDNKNSVMLMYYLQKNTTFEIKYPFIVYYAKIENIHDMCLMFIWITIHFEWIHRLQHQSFPLRYNNVTEFQQCFLFILYIFLFTSDFSSAEFPRPIPCYVKAIKTNHMHDRKNNNTHFEHEEYTIFGNLELLIY